MNRPSTREIQVACSCCPPWLLRHPLRVLLRHLWRAGGARPQRCVAAAQIFVFFPEEVKVGVKSIKTFAERMRNESVNRAIMVVIGSLTPFSRQCLAEMAPKYYIEVVCTLATLPLLPPVGVG